MLAVPGTVPKGAGWGTGGLRRDCQGLAGATERAPRTGAVSSSGAPGLLA